MIWIGVDAHKRLHQAVALGLDGVVARKAVTNTTVGWIEMLEWASSWPDRVWAIEGSGSLGRGLAQFLVGPGERVHEVSPRWTARRRRTMRRLGKSDVLDARAAAQLLRDEQLPAVQPETIEVASLRLWSRLRDDLVSDMTRVRNRLHALLLLCDPEYKQTIPSLLSQRGVQAARRYVAPGSTALDRVREQMVRRVAEHLALLGEQERELQHRLLTAVQAWFAPLLTIEGVGPLIAAGLIAERGLPRLDLGEAQLAALAGVAPLEASSAGEVRHRLSRQGNRRLNRLFHAIALVQERSYTPAQTYVARRRHEGRSSREARRALKRYLVRRVWRAWQACSTQPRPAASAP